MPPLDSEILPFFSFSAFLYLSPKCAWIYSRTLVLNFSLNILDQGQKSNFASIFQSFLELSIFIVVSPTKCQDVCLTKFYQKCNSFFYAEHSLSIMSKNMHLGSKIDLFYVMQYLKNHCLKVPRTWFFSFYIQKKNEELGLSMKKKPFKNKYLPFYEP